MKVQSIELQPVGTEADVRYYVREIKRLVGDWRRSTQVERVLILLLESGTIYCALWVRLHAALLTDMPLHHSSLFPPGRALWT